VTSFDSQSFKVNLATKLAVFPTDIVLRVAPASIVVNATITMPNFTAAVAATSTIARATPASLSHDFGVTVEAVGPVDAITTAMPAASIARAPPPSGLVPGQNTGLVFGLVIVVIAAVVLVVLFLQQLRKRNAVARRNSLLLKEHYGRMGDAGIGYGKSEKDGQMVQMEHVEHAAEI